MNTPTVGLRVSSVIFGLMCLAQLFRLVTQIEVVVAGHQVPFWPNTVAFVILGGLSFWMWQLSATASR